MFPAAALADSTAPAGGNELFGLTPEHEASLASLLSQMSSGGIGIYAVGANPPETPSGINLWTRVSCEIITPGVADYITPQDAVVRFTLDSPGDNPVSFSYKIISGSASMGYVIDDAQPTQGTVTFGQGETVKEIIINIAPLSHNPAEWGVISDREEYWKGERIFFLYCSSIQNAMFSNDRECVTISVPVVNNFNYEQAYLNAADTYLFDLGKLSGVVCYPETPGKYSNTDNEIKISIPIEGDVRTLIDTGVFTHIDFPTGHISSESTTPGSVEYRVDAIKQLWDGTPFVAPVLSEMLALDGSGETAFGGEREITAAGLGRTSEANSMTRSLDFILDYSMATDAVYTWFGDTAGNYPQNQVHFSDKAAPFVEQYSIPFELSGGAGLGDTVPIVVRYNEPVHTDNISAVIGEATLHPVEAAGTISESVTFLYEADEVLTDIYGGNLTVTNITGALDISGKQQVDFSGGSISIIVPFDAKKAFAYCAQPSVSIEQGESLQASGTITIPLKNYMELSNWLSGYMDIGNNLMSVAKVRVIGSDGVPVDVPLYAGISGERITELSGEFTPPVNQTGQDKYYAAEIYLDSDGPEGVGSFELIYGLTEEYTVAPIIFIDDAGDFEIVYTGWPAAGNVLADSMATLSLGYTVNVNATWQRPEDFTWSSSNTSVAAITAAGAIALTGVPGTAIFTLTASNAGLAGDFSIVSNTLTVVEAQSPFLSVPAGMQNIEILKGNDAKVCYSTNIPSRNDVFAGSGAATEFTFNLYEADYADGTPQKGSLVHTDTKSISVENADKFFNVPNTYLVNTSSKGTYSYILEISARDLDSDTNISASANICVKPLPAKAVLVKPDNLYMTDETHSFPVSFDIENRTSGMEYLLTVKKNNVSEPVFSTNTMDDIGKILVVPVSPVYADRLFDAYTILLKAKNEFDEVYSFDSYTLYVYNADAMKIVVGGNYYSSYTIKPDLDFPNMTSTHIFNTYREISYTIDRLSINKDDYKWSNIADGITWEVGDEGKLTLKFNGNIITGESSPLLLPGAALVLEGHESGSTYVTATHALTGMKATLPVKIEDIRNKLYIFQTYPGRTCEVTYKDGYNNEKTTQTDSNGCLGLYEESGIKGDVIFRPMGAAADLYGCAVIDNFQLYANQHSTNEFALYPKNTVELPKLNYRVTLELNDGQTGEPYTGDVIIRGGAWINGEYRHGVIDGYWRPTTTINGKRGDADQTVSAANGLYTLIFNPMEFTDGYGRLFPDDQIEYVIEMKFPGNSHYPQFIKVDNESIRKNINSPLGVYLKEAIRSVDATLIQNNAIVVSETLNVDGREYPFTENIVLTSEPQNITVSMEMILTDGDYGSGYSFKFIDGYGSYAALNVSAPAMASESYEFSDTVVLSGTVDLKPIFRSFRPGQKLSLYPIVRGQYTWLQLPKPIRIQRLYNIPNISEIFYREGGVPDLRKTLRVADDGPGTLDFGGEDDLVKDMLDVAGGFNIPWNDTYRFEIIPTDDPLVYKGIIRFAAGSYSRENPSGIFVAGDESIDYNFMPGYSDMKEMSKGEYLKKSREEMEKSKKGTSGYTKSYGGGAYMECEIRYDTEQYVWRILLLKSDMYVGGGITYYSTYNGWVSFVPVTATFKTGMTGEIGLKTIYDGSSGTRAYITELRPYFFTYGFAGAGFDYEIVALKIGPYGIISHDQRYLWYNRGNDKRNGQKLTISGSTGIEFGIKLLFIELNGKYELLSSNRSWTYNDFNAINNVFSTGKILWMFSGGTLVGFDETGLSVSGTAVFEDRSYLDGSDRKWNTPAAKSGIRSFAPLSASPVNILLPNAYPYSNPVLTGDGRMMVYLHDMESPDFMDTAVCFTTRANTEDTFPEGVEMDESGYPDSDVSVVGTKDNAVAVWTRMFTDFDGAAGVEATSEDIANMLAGTEIMAAVYNGESFTTTRLTANSTPDMAPVVAVSGNKAIAAWRSVAAGDMEKPLEFSGRDDIMYSIFDGTSWSEAKKLYDGSIDHVNALNAAILTDGTMAVTYQITEKNTENSEIMCIVLDEDGEAKTSLRLTNNETRDNNPHIVPAVFPDGIERFVLGWNTQVTPDGGSVQNRIRLSAVDSFGNLYTEFDREIGNASDGSNYAAFRFVKGARNIEDLSVVWNEPDLSTATGSEEIYRDCVWGIKMIREGDGTITQSGKLKLLELAEHNTADSFDAALNPETGEISFALLLSDYSSEVVQAKLANAKSDYQNEMIADEPHFAYEDVLPGLDMPILFRVQNAGAESISTVNIELGGMSNVFDEEVIRPGESRDFTVFRTVPDPVDNLTYTITAQFKSSLESKSKSGVLKLNVPDIAIEQINLTRESKRERGFSVLLQNSSYAGLVEGRHTVRLEVYNTTDFENSTPLAVQTISDADRLNMLNDGMLPLSITLSGEAVTKLLDENGEIPENGTWVFFNAVLEEDGNVIEDADIGNNMDYIKVHSLIEKNGAPISIASMTKSTDGQTVVHVEAFNNSMNGVTNGNIIVTLKDQSGRILATQQTYNPADAPGNLINAAGEDTCAASFLFEQAGSFADVAFSRIDEKSTQLSVLKMSGVPLDFDKDAYQYDIEVADKTETFITAVAENPDSTVAITRNGLPVSASQPCTLSYGTNTFIITVTTGGQKVAYTVNVTNIKGEGNNGGEDSEDSSGNTAGTPVSAYNASVIMGGVKRMIALSVKDGKVVISLGGLADEIFTGSQNTVLTVPLIPGVNAYTLEMPAGALSGSYGKGTLTVQTAFGEITVPSGMLAGMAGLDGKTAGIRIEPGDRTNLPENIKAAIGDKPVIQFSLYIDGKRIEWNNPDTPVTVSIPCTPSAAEAANPESIVVWYIDNSGKAFCVPNGRYDPGCMGEQSARLTTSPSTGMVTFSTRHFSCYAASYNKVGFNDVPGGVWFNKAVSYIAARGITSGTGGGNYSPGASLTRGEFIVMMMRAYGITPDENISNDFSDAGDAYYTGYLAAAKRLGISAGVGNNMYAPGKEITRQEMFTLLYNALKSMGQLTGGDSGRSLSDFTDAGQISNWAKDAVEALVKTGIARGSDGKLYPTGTATRAEMAQVLYCFLFYIQ